jgi:hypothetical protein
MLVIKKMALPGTQQNQANEYLLHLNKSLQVLQFSFILFSKMLPPYASHSEKQIVSQYHDTKPTSNPYFNRPNIYIYIFKYIWNFP